MHITEVFCYPIKSCGGISLQEAKVGVRGIEHDREYMVVDTESGMFVAQRQSGKLGIEIKSMCQIRVRFAAASGLLVSAPGMSWVVVDPKRHGKECITQVWKATGLQAYDMGDYVNEWFTNFLSRERPGKYRLVRMSDKTIRQAKIGNAQAGFQDGYPFMGISQGALDGLNGRLWTKDEPEVPMNRFRPNFVFGGCDRHAEDHMKIMKIGGEDGVTFDGMTLCERCPLPGTNQETAVRTKEPLATLSLYRRGRHIGVSNPAQQNLILFGRNFNHRGPGYLRVGDPVKILESD